MIRNLRFPYLKKLSPLAHPEPSYTHFPLAQQPVGAMSLKSQLSTVPLPDNCVMTPVFQNGAKLHTFLLAQQEKSPFYSTFARQLCDDTCLPGWLPTFSAHSQTFKST